ncbi:MAG: hypothetical protein RMZ69_15170 [Nostoc sp. ChiQUE01a]|nr:hypothetical protein [Nostoc sp. ChiQUE01a]
MEESTNPEVVKSINNHQLFDVNQSTNRDNLNQFEPYELLLNNFDIKEKVEQDRNLSDNSGSTRVMQSLQALEDSPLKSFLSNEIGQLQAEVKALRQQQNVYQKLIEKRLQQPQNISWWQQSIHNVSGRECKLCYQDGHSRI